MSTGQERTGLWEEPLFLVSASTVIFVFSSFNIKIILYCLYEHRDLGLRSHDILFHLSLFKISSATCWNSLFLKPKSENQHTLQNSEMKPQSEKHIFIYLLFPRAFTRQKKQAFIRVTQAGWAQLYLKHRHAQQEQWELSALRTDTHAEPWGLQQSSVPLTTFRIALLPKFYTAGACLPMFMPLQHVQG